MSVCVAAEYPWAEIQHLQGTEPPGVILCCDTRVCFDLGQGRYAAIKDLAAKFRKVGKSIMVCFTSSNLFAATQALNDVGKTADVRRIGDSLRKYHQKFGGRTDLLAVAWRDRGIPQVLQVMSPDYQPEPRSGIVGIGDNAVLERFRADFHKAPGPKAGSIVPTSELIQSVRRQFGNVNVTGFPINEAAIKVAAAFCDAIKTAGGKSVGLPMASWIITGKGAQAVSYATLSANNEFTYFGPGEQSLVVPTNPPPRSARDQSVASAVQLFD